MGNETSCGQKSRGQIVTYNPRVNMKNPKYGYLRQGDWKPHSAVKTKLWVPPILTKKALKNPMWQKMTTTDPETNFVRQIQVPAYVKLPDFGPVLTLAYRDDPIDSVRYYAVVKANPLKDYSKGVDPLKKLGTVYEVPHELSDFQSKQHKTVWWPMRYIVRVVMPEDDRAILATSDGLLSMIKFRDLGRTTDQDIHAAFQVMIGFEEDLYQTLAPPRIAKLSDYETVKREGEDSDEDEDKDSDDKDSVNLEYYTNKYSTIAKMEEKDKRLGGGGGSSGGNDSDDSKNNSLPGAGSSTPASSSIGFGIGAMAGSSIGGRHGGGRHGGGGGGGHRHGGGGGRRHHHHGGHRHRHHKNWGYGRNNWYLGGYYPYSYYTAPVVSVGGYGYSDPYYDPYAYVRRRPFLSIGNNVDGKSEEASESVEYNPDDVSQGGELPTYDVEKLKALAIQCKCDLGGRSFIGHCRDRGDSTSSYVRPSFRCARAEVNEKGDVVIIPLRGDIHPNIFLSEDFKQFSQDDFAIAVDRRNAPVVYGNSALEKSGVERLTAKSRAIYGDSVENWPLGNDTLTKEELYGRTQSQQQQQRQYSTGYAY